MSVREPTGPELRRLDELLRACGPAAAELTAEERRLLLWLAGWDDWTLDAAIVLFRRLRKAPATAGSYQ
jgi:hypothetical protein